MLVKKYEKTALVAIAVTEVVLQVLVLERYASSNALLGDVYS